MTKRLLVEIEHDIYYEIKTIVENSSYAEYATIKQFVNKALKEKLDAEVQKKSNEILNNDFKRGGDKSEEI